MTQAAEDLARRARIRAVEMCMRAKAAHIGSSLSVIDILAALYAGGAHVSPAHIDDPDRDFVIVSKGHAAAGTYAVLAESGFFPMDWLESYGMDGSLLGGHVTNSVPGVELSTGSLGHGLPFGTGLALAAQRQGSGRRVYVVMSDGECDEGTTWESALFAAHHTLGNLTVLVDRNGIQSLAGTEETLRLEPFAEKWRAFGWRVIEVDGHDHAQLASALGDVRLSHEAPTAIICRTVKGKGVSFMENMVLWHYRPPTGEDARLALLEIADGAR